LKNNIATATLVTALIALTGTTQAQDAMFRYDATGSFLSHTLGIEDKNGVGFYAFSFNTNFPEYDFGQIKKIHSGKNASLYGGGYVAYLPGSNQGNAWFLQPWLIGDVSVGEVGFHLAVGVYAPLNGGPTILFVNEGSALYSASSKLKVGISSTYWNQPDAKPVFRYGPQLKMKLGGGYDLNVADYMFGHHSKNFRVILTKSF
jgi:hypothetical protein